ncbi:glycosyltransferase [Reyranella sp.]|uniref:glycosyltransferase n=1 Tax=Reyranella sp. TaxID=1929291 RepID=UPI003D0BBE00
MEPGILAWLGFGWWSLGSAIQWTSAALARSPRQTLAASHTPRDFSIVAPMAGVEDATADYVLVLRRLAEAGAEVLICVARDDDPAVAPTIRIWPEAQILVGTDDTFNPKMNNVRKGLEAASREVVALCDAGIQLSLEELTRAAAPLAAGTGLVLALKAADAPQNFAAEIERAYIDGHQAKFLFAADRLGLAVASGGVTIMTRDTLQRIGNWRGFNRWIADDYSVVRSVRELGLPTSLGAVMPRLPLGERSWSTVWRRQVRWARTRLRLPVWPLVLWEPAIGWAATGAAGVAALVCSGANGGLVVGALLLHTLAWLLAEKWFMTGRGLPFGMRGATAALVRELLAPVLIVSALSGRAIQWRGTDLGGQWRDRRGPAEDSSKNTESGKPT